MKARKYSLELENLKYENIKLVKQVNDLNTIKFTNGQKLMDLLVGNQNQAFDNMV